MSEQKKNSVKISLFCQHRILNELFIDAYCTPLAYHGGTTHVHCSTATYHLHVSSHLYMRSRSSSIKNKADESKSLHTTSLCYSIAKSTFYKYRKPNVEISILFLSFLLSFSDTHNWKLCTCSCTKWPLCYRASSFSSLGWHTCMSYDWQVYSLETVFKDVGHSCLGTSEASVHILVAWHV